MVREHRAEYPADWATMCSIAEKLGCKTETLRQWVRRTQRDESGGGEALSADERERLKALERENRELRRTNEILCLASAFFAQAELDRHDK
jgi:transposase-like protein